MSTTRSTVQSHHLRNATTDQPKDHDIIELTTDICFMCCSNNLTGVQTLLNAATIFEPVPYYTYARAIDCACLSGNVEIAKWLYTQCPEYIFGGYIFMEACVYGYRSVALWMLDENKSLLGVIDDTLLNEMYECGHAEFTQILMSYVDKNVNANHNLIVYLTETV
jgi:hypothetical protein